MDKIIQWIKPIIFKYKKEIIIFLIGGIMGIVFTWFIFTNGTRELRNTIKELNSRISSITTELSSANDTIGKLTINNADLTRLIGEAKDLDTKRLAEIRKLKESLSTAERRISEITVNSRDLEEKLNLSRGRVEELEKRVAELQADFGRITLEIQHHLTRIETLEGAISADASTITELRNQISQYLDRIGKLESIINSITGTSTELDQAIRNLTRGFAAITTESEDIGEILGKLLTLTEQSILEVGRIEQLNREIESRLRESK